MKNFLTLIVFIFSTTLISQNLDFGGEITFLSVGSNKEEIPFWMYTNTNTALGQTTNFSGIGDLKTKYSFESSFIEAGVAVFYRDGMIDDFQRRDLYLRYQNSWLSTTIGAKQQEIEVEGLSATNKNILWSSNARPLPGLIIEANNPIKISETFSIDWGIAHYSLNDERYVDDVWLHYKRLGLITTFNDHNKLTAKIQHFAQWAGTSPTFGKLPNDLSAFIEVFFAKQTSTEGENANVLGNHLGSIMLDYEFVTNIGDFSVYYDHPFEDRSGLRFANFPDGVWGVFYTPENKKIISNFLYEYIDTSDQSGNTSISGFDNYFSNNLYRSGWTYEGNIIGLPFIMTDKDIVINDITSPIVSNRVRLHHIGVSGSFNKIEWMLKTTFSKNLGTYNKPFNPTLENWYNYVSFSYTTNLYGTFILIGGVDISNLNDTIVGGGLSYSYSF